MNIKLLSLTVLSRAASASRNGFDLKHRSLFNPVDAANSFFKCVDIARFSINEGCTCDEVETVCDAAQFAANGLAWLLDPVIEDISQGTLDTQDIVDICYKVINDFCTESLICLARVEPITECCADTGKIGAPCTLLTCVDLPDFNKDIDEMTTIFDLASMALAAAMQSK